MSSTSKLLIVLLFFPLFGSLGPLGVIVWVALFLLSGKIKVSSKLKSLNLGVAALEVIVGFLILMAALSLIVGWGTAQMILLMSVLCTAGLGLLIWVPVSYSIGHLIFSWLGIFKSSTNTTISESSSEATFSSPIVESLNRYISQSRLHNMTDKQIRTELTRVGWSKEAIDEAFKGPRTPVDITDSTAEE